MKFKLLITGLIIIGGLTTVNLSFNCKYTLPKVKLSQLQASAITWDEFDQWASENGIDPNEMTVVDLIEYLEENGYPGGTIEAVYCFGSSTYNNPPGSQTISWVSYWFENSSNPTTEELTNMHNDLSMNRAETDISFTFNPTQHQITTGIEGGWDFLATATGQITYSSTLPTVTQSYTKPCCQRDYYDYCTHLPPCEAYPYQN